MLAVERRNKIEEIILKQKSVLVVDLSKEFNVTTETIRADLEKLEKQGVLVRTYGDATLSCGSETEISVFDREVINFEGKQRIGQRAHSLPELALSYKSEGPDFEGLKNQLILVGNENDDGFRQKETNLLGKLNSA